MEVPVAKVEPMTVPALRAMKARGERIAALTAYDHSFSARLDEAGVDVVLVGDSLGMVIQGYKATLAVTIEHIAYHVACVARVRRRHLVMADMPFATYPDPARAFDNAARLVAAGAAIVKLEGAGPVLESLRYLAEREIPVCAHLGLTPQSVLRFGGFKLQGGEAEAAERLRHEARAVQDAGAAALVLECVPAALAREISRELTIPTIGIGAGADCDGQILVVYDALGITPGRRPRFVRNFMPGRESITDALRAYVAAVRDGSFPNANEAY
jgi:3-methyl-2-oxobutanoate hydroxymethyltransferase